MKKRGLIITFLIVLFIGGLNLYLYFNKGSASYNSLSGMFIKEIPKLTWGANLSIFIFVGLWVLLLIIILISYTKFLGDKKEENVKMTYQEIKQRETKSRTDLDILYEILKDKKRLSIVTIAKVFRIEKEKALEWAKILENHELVTIEYPVLNNPEVRINEKEVEIPPKKEAEGNERKGKVSQKEHKNTKERRKKRN